jgi:hypothetical protein
MSVEVICQAGIELSRRPCGRPVSRAELMKTLVIPHEVRSRKRREGTRLSKR